MDTATKDYINSLDRRSIPWSRMFTAYGTAENYNELLSELEQTTDTEQWKRIFNRISDFEHQSTMFPPAPFVMVFLVRMLQMFLQNGNAGGIVQKLLDQFMYYIEVCNDVEKMEHAQPLAHMWDLLDDGNLLPEDHTEEDLLEIFEDPDAVSEELFYSFYYYSKIVLSQVRDILEQYGEHSEDSKLFRDQIDIEFLLYCKRTI